MMTKKEICTCGHLNNYHFQGGCCDKCGCTWFHPAINEKNSEDLIGVNTKLLYASLNGEENDLYHAFQKKFDTCIYKDVRHAINWKPDIIHIHSGALDPQDLVKIKRYINPIVTQFTGDASHVLLEPVKWYKELADLTLLTVGIGQKRIYENYLRHSVSWMPEAVRLDQCIEPKKDVDNITFIGNYYDHLPEGPMRLKIAEKLVKDSSPLVLVLAYIRESCHAVELLLLYTTTKVLHCQPFRAVPLQYQRVANI